MRARCELTGFVGAPGLNTWFFLNSSLTQSVADGISGGLKLFYEELAANRTLQCTVQAPVDVAELDPASGQTIGFAVPADTSWEVAQPTGGSSVSRATQLKLRLLTGQFQNGRQVRGGVFIGPVDGGVLDLAGQVRSTSRQEVVTAAQNLVGNLNLVGVELAVYSRPTPSRAGSGFVASSVDVAPQPAVLKSRRD